MTDPFDSLFAETEVQDPEWVKVVDSELECERCWQISTEGEYNYPKKALRWKCSQGHVNIIAPMEIG